MNTLVAEYWILLVVALVIGLVVAWYLFHASRRTRVTGSSKDVLDEGADRAQRNNALIDSAPAATRETASPEPDALPLVSAAAAPEAPDSTIAAVVVEVEESAESEDDLTRIKGVGPKLAAILADLGVTRFSQIAAWDDAEIQRINSHLGRFEGRITRDDWVGQARLLAAGDAAGYTAQYGAWAELSSERVVF